MAEHVFKVGDKVTVLSVPTQEDQHFVGGSGTVWEVGSYLRVLVGDVFGWFESSELRWDPTLEDLRQEWQKAQVAMGALRDRYKAALIADHFLQPGHIFSGPNYFGVNITALVTRLGVSDTSSGDGDLEVDVSYRLQTRQGFHKREDLLSGLDPQRYQIVGVVNLAQYTEDASAL